MESRNGALITDVVEDSPAEKAGIQEGDVIVQFNGKSISDPSNLKNVVSLTAPESSNKVKIFRNGSPKTINVVLKELPDSPGKLSIKNSDDKDIFGLKLKRVNRSLKDKYDIEDSGDFLVVIGVDQNGEGYDKGIREGDIIKNVGTKRVTSVKEFNRLVEKSRKRYGSYFS